MRNGGRPRPANGRLRSTSTSYVVGVRRQGKEGQKIAFARGPNGSEQIYVMNADGSDLSEPLTSGNAPSWSPDGQKIVFQTDRDGNDEIYVMNADGTQVRPLTGLPQALRKGAPDPNSSELRCAGTAC